MNLDKDDQSAHYPMKEEHLVLTIHILEAKKYHNSIGGGGGSKRPPKSTLYLFCHFCFWVNFHSVRHFLHTMVLADFASKACGAKLSSFHYGAKLSKVPNCPLFIVVPNCPVCQIVLWAKLSSFTLRCQIVMVPNRPRCQIVPGAKLSYTQCISNINLYT